MPVYSFQYQKSPQGCFIGNYSIYDLKTYYIKRMYRVRCCFHCCIQTQGTVITAIAVHFVTVVGRFQATFNRYFVCF